MGVLLQLRQSLDSVGLYQAQCLYLLCVVFMWQQGYNPVVEGDGWSKLIVVSTIPRDDNINSHLLHLRDC